MKTHDWFAANLFQPEMSTDDFYNAGLTPDNTGMKSRDEYKSNPTVIDAFTKDGKFDEQSYNTFYDNALLTYNQYSNKEFNKKVLEEYEYDPAEWRVSGNKKDTSAVFQVGKNNLRRESYGVESLGLTSAPEFSMREIAQMNEVRDADGNKLGYTPNEKGGLFKGLGRETLVLAQWEDGEVEVINGKEIVHKKGDLKLDENGNPYYEELGNRDIYGRDVLHYTDTLTDDGSKWNKYDFFDSDGLEKSIGGTLMKTAAKLAPYVVSGTIGGPVGWIWGGVNAALEMAKVLPTLGKAVNGILGGSDENALGQGLSKWEGYLSRFESSTSDATRNQPWSVETLGDLVSDIAGQLYQQRVVSMIPGLLDKAGFTKGLMKNKKLGEELALGYMAATSARESYGSFREAGANEATAGLAAVANLLALNGLMRTDYFRKTMFKGSFFDDDILKGVAKDVARQVRMDNTIDGTASKTALNKLAQLYENKLRSKLTDYGGAMLREGLEEMMEESVSDVSKGITEGLSLLGFKVSDSGKNLDFGWSRQDFLTRYGMSFIGGAIGGGIFNLSNDWNLRGQSELIKQLDNSSLAKMSYLIAEGRTQELKDFYTKMHKKGMLGDANLSASKFQTVTDINGNNETIAETEGKSQNDMIYEQLIGHIDYMETLISEEGLKMPHDVALKMAQALDQRKLDDHRLLRAQALNLSMVNGGFLNDFNRLTTEIVKERANLDSLLKKYGGETDKEQRESGNAKENEDVRKSLEKLKTLREERDAMLSGERLWFYTERGRFVMDEGTHKQFLDLSIEKFTETLYGKRYVDLSDSEKEQVDEDYQDYLNTEGKRNMYRAYEIYNKVSELFAEILQNQTTDLATRVEDTIHSKKTNVAEYFEKYKKLSEIANKIVPLNAKSDRTPEEDRELSDLLSQYHTLDSEINTLQQNPNEMLRGSVEGETSIRPIIQSGQLTTASELVKGLYNKYISGKTYVRSEDELNDFYRFAKAKQTKTMVDRFNSFLGYWYDTPMFNPNGEIPIDFDEQFRINDEALLTQDGEADSGPQQEFVRLMQALETSIGTKSFANKYKEVFDFIKANAAVSDEQAKFMIAELLKITPIDEDGNVVENESFDLLTFVEEMEQLRDKVYTSPIYELLGQFSVEFSDGKTDILSVLEGEINHLATRENVQDYIIRNPLVREELEKIAKFLNVLKGAVNGAYSGMNEAANKLRTSDMVKLAELDENSYKLIMNDISALQMKINDLWNLDRMNSADKLKVHKQTEMKLKPKQVKWMLSDGFVSGFEAEFGVNLKQIWANLNPNFDLDAIDDNNWTEFESARIEFESAIYDALKDKSSKDKINSIFKLFGNNLYQMESTRINTNTDVWTGYDMALYLMDILSIRSSDFHQRYKEVLEREPAEGEKLLAPVFGQELAIRRSVAMAANVDEYNMFVDKLKEQAGADSDVYIQNKRTLHNVSSVFGGAGTGKTVAISKIIAEMLSFDDGVEFVYVAPGEQQVKKLKDSVGKDGKQYTASEFFNSFTEGITPDKMVYNADKESMEFDIPLKGTVFSDGKTRKVIIVDESTLFNVAEWESLSRIAEREGAIVIALGDLKQNQAKTDVKIVKEGEKESKGVVNNGIEDFVGVRSPLLTTSLRAGNEAKFQNATILDEKLSRVIAQSHTKTSLKEFDTAFNSENSDGFRMGYYNAPDGSAFVGELFIDNDSEATMFLRRFANEPGATVAYITDKKNFELPSDIAAMTLGDDPKVRVIQADQAQGGEFDYVIVDKKWDYTSDKSTFNLARDLYTLTQRSVKGSVIVDRGVKSALKIDNYSDQNLTMDSAPSDGLIKDFADWKVKVGLGNISVVSSHFGSYFPEKVGVANQQQNQNQQGQQQQGNPENTSENNNPVGSGNPTPNEEVVNTDEDTGESIPEYPWEPESEPIAMSPTPTYNNEPPLPEPPEPTFDTNLPPLRRVETKEEPYCRWISSGTAYRSVRKDFDVTEEQFNYLVPQIASAIKGGISKEVFIPRIMMNPIMNNMYDLQDFLENANLEIWVENFDGNQDIVVAKFIGMGAGKPEVHIPITFIEKGHVGKYTGGFHLHDGAKFKRGEWISLSQLKQKYPGLHIISQWGVYSDEKDNYRSTQEKHGDKNYLGRNNGKVMTFVTGDAYQYVSFDQSSTWEHGVGIVKGTKVKWAHQNYRETTQFGIERSISVSDFMRFLRIRHDRYAGTLNDDQSKLGISSANEFEQRVLATDEVFKTKPAKGEDNTAFMSQISSRRFQVVNYQTKDKLFSFIFNSLPKISNTRFRNDILSSLRFLQNDKGSNYTLKIRNKDKKYYVYYSGGKFHLYESKVVSGEREFTTKTPIRSFELVNHKFPISDLLNYFGGTVEQVSFGFIGENGSIPELTVNEQLYYLFWDITRNAPTLTDSQYISEIEDVFRNSEEFKHGIFGNIAGGNFHLDTNCSARRFIGTQDDFLTDASEWTYPVYLMDFDSIERGTQEEIEQQSNERITLAEDKEAIKKLVSGKLDMSNIGVIIDGMKTTEEVVDYVNGLLKGDHWKFSQIQQTESGEFKLVTIDNREEFLQSKIAEFGFDSGNIEYRFLESCKTAIFSVSLQGYILRMNDSNEWECVPFNSFPTFKEVYDKVTLLEKSGADVMAIKSYLRDTISNQQTVSINQLYENPSFGLVANEINNYLLQRLTNEEC